MVEFIFVACFHKFNFVLWVREIGFAQNDIFSCRFRLFEMFQHESLNLRLLYRLMEAFLCSLFPERDLSQGFDTIRSQIKQKYSIQ